MNTFKIAATAASVLVGAAFSASAATVNLSSITGQWQNIGSTGPVAGAGTDKIEWGVPCCGNNTNNGSSYEFNAATTPANTVPNPFDLGEFVHNNFTIEEGFLDSVDLSVNIMGDVDGTGFNITPVFSFTHFETPNGGSPCAAGGAQPCPDLVTLVNSVDLSETFIVGTKEFTLNVLGFDTGVGPLTSFLTLEAQSNSAILKASISEIELPQVPLPAAGWLLVAGLGGLVAMRRRPTA